jgi:hypothetical protein
MKILVFGFVFCMGISALAETTCPADLNDIVAAYSQKATAQSAAINKSKGLMAFQDESHHVDYLYRYASKDAGISYVYANGRPLLDPGKLTVRGAHYQVSNDLQRTAPQRKTLELTLENYEFSFYKVSSENSDVFIYELKPRGRVTGRFMPYSQIEIDRLTFLPVRVTGDVYAHSAVSLKLDVTFQRIEGLAIPLSLPRITDVRSRVIGFPYHMQIVTTYSPQDIELSQGLTKVP